MDGRAQIGDKDCAHVNLYAGEDKPYHTLQLFIDDTALEIVRIVMKGREGSDVTYTVTSFPLVGGQARDVHLPADKHPGVDLIDNRI